MLRNLLGLAAATPGGRGNRKYRHAVEGLEARCVPSTLPGSLRSSLSAAVGQPLNGVAPGDRGADVRADLEVYRPATGQWLLRGPGGSTTITQFGDPSQGDIPVPGNYEGNGTTDLAVFRPATGQWLIRLADGSVSIRPTPGFVPGDLPVPGDYEGIDRTDLAVYRPGTGEWYVQKNSGVTAAFRFGDPTQGDVPVPADYEGTGRLDFAVFRPSSDTWIIRLADGRVATRQFGSPPESDIPVPGDFEGTGTADLAVYRPATGQWVIRLSNGGTLTRPFGDPARNDVPAGPAQTDVVAPRPFNAYLTAGEWTSLHTEFATSAAAGKHDVVFLGDSVTFLWSDAGKTPGTSEIRHRFLPPRGTASWNSTFAPLGAVNFGIMGDTTHGLLWRVLNGELAGSPRVAVMMIGINDLSTGVPPRATAAGISADVQAIRATSPATKVLLLGVLAPSSLLPGDPLVTAVKLTNATVARWAADHGVTFEDFNPQLAGNVDSLRHPTTQGYAILANAIKGPLTALLNGPAVATPVAPQATTTGAPG